jgi:Raf kinase inhibitor-like YbhB/YbcL family protein
MRIHSDSFRPMQPIPQAFALCLAGAGDTPCEWAGNRSPHLAWDEVPEGTLSFALACIDGDAPASMEDANRADRRIPASVPRVDFVHWIMVDIPRECRELAEGSCSAGVVPHGKRNPPGPPGSRQGLNDYGRSFAGDAAMAGDYHGYDGPCPPWNDERLHRYRFHLYALGVATLALPERFGYAEARAALEAHVLAEAALSGTYTLNPALRR